MTEDKIQKDIDNFLKKLEESTKTVEPPEKAPGAPEKAKEKAAKAEKKSSKADKVELQNSLEKTVADSFPSLSDCPIEKFEEVKNHLVGMEKKGLYNLGAVANKFQVKYDNVLKQLWASIQQVDLVKPAPAPVAWYQLANEIKKDIALFITLSLSAGISKSSIHDTVKNNWGIDPMTMPDIIINKNFYLGLAGEKPQITGSETKVTEPKETSDEEIIAYIKSLPNDFLYHQVEEAVLKHFPLLHSSYHLTELIVDALKAEEAKVLPEGEAADYSEFEKKLAEVVGLFADSVKGEMPVPDQPTITVVKDSSGWKAEVWNGPTLVVKAIPLLPPGPTPTPPEALYDYLSEALSKLKKLPTTPTNTVMEKLALSQLKESLLNMQNDFYNFVENMSILLDSISGEVKNEGLAEKSPEPEIVNGISAPIVLETPGNNFGWSDFAYLPLPKGFTKLIGVIISGAKEGNDVYIEILAGEKSFYQKIQLGPVIAYDFSSYLNQEIFKEVAGIKVRAGTSIAEKLIVEFQYEKEVDQ